jgi:hypothetical protein
MFPAESGERGGVRTIPRLPGKGQETGQEGKKEIVEKTKERERECV